MTLNPQFMLSVGKLCEFAQVVESDSHSVAPEAFIGVSILHNTNI
jgi:hypothetical protein